MQPGVYRISALYPGQNKLKEVEVFGYCSKGIPGLEIVGLGSLGRAVKEKFIFMSRQLSLRIPLKRYVLCVDLPIELKSSKGMEDCRWLELPLLILFWNLSGQMVLENLKDCISIGKVQVNGTIISVDLSLLEANKTIIAPLLEKKSPRSPFIPLEEIFSEFIGEGLSYELSKLRVS